MKKIIRIAMVTLLAMALLIPAFTVQASAVTYRWSGTSTMKTGRSYAVTAAVTMDSNFTVPAGTTLTVYSTGTLNISKGVKATINGTLIINKGGKINLYGTMTSAESSTVKVSGKLSYSGSAKLQLNGGVTVTTSGTVSGTGTATVNLSAKSQYNADVDKINTYYKQKNYSKACSLLQSAITNYPAKASTLRPAYSTIVIEWADKLGNEKDYVKACSILNSARKYLTDTTDVDNRYEYWQGYIPVPIKTLKNWGDDLSLYTATDTFGNTYYECYNPSYSKELEFLNLGGKYTNFSATLACEGNCSGGNDIYVEVFVDGISVFVSEPVYNTTKPFDINVDITGADTILIKMNSYWNHPLIMANATVYKE